MQIIFEKRKKLNKNVGALDITTIFSKNI